jgi:DNA-binding PadR family transcriptional regulator
MRSYRRTTKSANHRATGATSTEGKARAVSAPPYTFQILDTLDAEVVTSQRQLSEATGISLGQVNATLRRLMEKRLVTIGHLDPESGRVQRVYRLTAKGKQAKAKLAVNFITAHLEESRRLKARLVSRLAPLQKDGRRVVVLGPEEIGNFVDCTIKLENLDLRLVDHCPTVENLGRLNAKDFDLVLLFDTAHVGLETIARKAGLSVRRFVPLW